MAEQDREAIGKRIREIRSAQGISVKELAAMAGMSPGYLSEVERGQSAVSSEKLMDIAHALRVTVGRLLGETDANESSQEVTIPAALSQAAEEENWSHRTTLLLLEGKLSLTARRSRNEERNWEVHDWKRFYRRVRDYLPED